MDGVCCCNQVAKEKAGRSDITRDTGARERIVMKPASGWEGTDNANSRASIIEILQDRI